MEREDGAGKQGIEEDRDDGQPHAQHPQRRPLERNVRQREINDVRTRRQCNSGIRVVASRTSTEEGQFVIVLLLLLLSIPVIFL